MFCLSYYPPKQQYYENADELRIEYRASDASLPHFIETFKNKTIIIELTKKLSEADLIILKTLSKKFHNIKLIFSFYEKEILEQIQQTHIPFFFSNHINTIDKMSGLIKYHPTDMYICEELGFCLDKVSELLHKNNIRVRVYPNICQSSFPEMDSLKTFFIRPEDIAAYSQYVDVFELIADEARQPVVFKIYQQQEWFGPIQEIIPTFHNSLDSRFLMPAFGMLRAKCHKRCAFNPNVCKICNRFSELSETLKKNRLLITKIQKKSYEENPKVE